MTTVITTCLMSVYLMSSLLSLFIGVRFLSVFAFFRFLRCYCGVRGVLTNIYSIYPDLPALETDEESEKRSKGSADSAAKRRRLLYPAPAETHGHRPIAKSTPATSTRLHNSKNKEFVEDTGTTKAKPKKKKSSKKKKKPGNCAGQTQVNAYLFLILNNNSGSLRGKRTCCYKWY